jgi:hypothetical protein
VKVELALINGCVGRFPEFLCVHIGGLGVRSLFFTISLSCGITKERKKETKRGDARDDNNGVAG